MKKLLLFIPIICLFSCEKTETESDPCLLLGNWRLDYQKTTQISLVDCFCSYSHEDNDGDGIVNDWDPCPDSSDCDQDGIQDNDDPCPENNGWIDVTIINCECESDINDNGVCDEDDNDIDGDGISNDEDPCQYNAHPDCECESDIDNDGICDQDDSDIDGDGISNEYDFNCDTSIGICSLLTFSDNGIASVIIGDDEENGLWEGGCKNGENFFVSMEHAVFNYVILSVDSATLVLELNDGDIIQYFNKTF